MNTQQDENLSRTAEATSMTRGQRFIEWIQEPFGSIMAASVATIGSFGVVLSSMWAIQVALN